MKYDVWIDTKTKESNAIGSRTIGNFDIFIPLKWEHRPGAVI
jgi:hypothetical protein